MGSAKKIKAYLIVGCPGSGKSWIADRLKDSFHLIHHDLHIGMAGDAYVEEIKKQAPDAKKPILIEAPFSISQIKQPLEEAGFEIVPVFIQEFPHTIASRYFQREGKEIPRGHLTRQNTYSERAKEWGAFQGTSEEVFKHLKKIAEEQNEKTS